MQKAQVIAQLPALIKQMQTEIRWKPGSAARHLLKRKLRGHLPKNVTLGGYGRIIRTVLTTDKAVVYLYWYGNNVYPTVVAVLDEKHWLVMFSLDGVLESAFVVGNPEAYLSPPEFERVGLLNEVLV